MFRIPTEVGIAKAMFQQPAVSIPHDWHDFRWFRCIFHVMAMSCQELCWKSLSAELLKWLHQLVEEHTETCLVEDFLKRGALPLLFFAKKAKSEIQNAKVSKTKATNRENSEPKKLATGENSAAAVSALLCIRLLAQQLQSMAQSTLVQQSNEFRVEGEAVCCRSMGLSPSVSPNKASLTTPPPSMTPETEDLALALAHWVSTEWCSPRIEVVVAWLCLTDSVRFVCPRFVRQFHWHTQHLKALKRGKFRRNGRHNSTRIWKFEEKLTYLTWFVYVCSLTARKNVRTTYPAALIRSFCPKIVTIWS